MSAQCLRCHSTWAKDPALAVQCPSCRAKAGSRCHRPSGHECEVHTARDQAALDAGLISRCPGAPAEQGALL